MIQFIIWLIHCLEDHDNDGNKRDEPYKEGSDV